jgi:molybdopterin-binding protein
MKISARNVIKGKIKSVNSDNINAEIIVEISGGSEIVSVITKNSAENLHLIPDKEVYVVIKASNVMIAID